MRRSRVATLVVLALALSALSITPASAETSPLGTSLMIGSPKLSRTRVFVTVPLNVSCSSTTFSNVLSELVSVTVSQASGRDISFGSGYLQVFPPGLLFPCDNTTHTVSLTVFPNFGSPTFHGGLANVSAQVNLQGFDEFGTMVFDGVSIGLETVTISGGA